MRTAEEIGERIQELEQRSERYMGQKRARDSADCLSDANVLRWALGELDDADLGWAS